MKYFIRKINNIIYFLNFYDFIIGQGLLLYRKPVAIIFETSFVSFIDLNLTANILCYTNKADLYFSPKYILDSSFFNPSSTNSHR